MNAGAGFDPNVRREEKSIRYIPLDQVDKSKYDYAITIIPLRLGVIQATFPLHKQVEEFRRALRLKRDEPVAPFGPHFEGFEVKRRILGPPGRDGKPPVLQDWEDYKYEDKFAEMIDSRRLKYHIEDRYLLPFIRYDEGLVMPLPDLVPDLAKYPEPRLPAIVDAIAELKAKGRQPETASEFLLRMKAKTGRRDLFKPTEDEAANRLMKKDPGTPPPAPAGKADAAAIDVDNLLLRFIDPDITPGRTYEYQIRLRMLNPNFQKPELVSNPSSADVEILYGPWVQIADPVQVPNESFFFAYDTKEYQDAVGKLTTDAGLAKRLKAADNQAVVEVQTWMEQVKVDGSGNREPVGAWVVAEMPVMRGEYVGRRQYLKLPLWSSEDGKFVLREVPSTSLGVKPAKGKEPPRGWVVDFSTKSILVDFEGGKVHAKVGARDVSDEAGTELLIVRPDGKLMVRNSAEDMRDAGRAERDQVWLEWVKKVEAQKESAGAAPGSSGFTIPGKP